jgi:transcriptional regulator with XRE-family HTH domain
MKNPKFAKAFRSEMKKRGLNGKKTALLCGIPESAVSQYASGRVTPTAEMVAKIEAAFADSGENAETSEKLSQCANMPIREAAAALGISERMLRNGLKAGVFPFGFGQRRRLRWRFHISPGRLREYAGERAERCERERKNRVTIAECASVLGVCAQFLRCAVRKGAVSFAAAICGQKRVRTRFKGRTTTVFVDNGRRFYYINPRKFYEYAENAPGGVPARA